MMYVYDRKTFLKRFDIFPLYKEVLNYKDNINFIKLHFPSRWFLLELLTQITSIVYKCFK